MPGTPRKAAAKPAKKATAAPRKTAPRKATAMRTLPPPPPVQDEYNLGQATNEEFFDLVMPSGQRCQARRPGVQGLIAAGILDSFDQLTSIVQIEHIDRKSTAALAKRPAVTPEQQAEAAQEMIKDPAKMAAGLEMVDKLVVYLVNRPGLWVDYQMIKESKEDWERRQMEQSGRTPVRNVRMGDKLFIVQWAVGGTSDLEAFRKEFGGSLDDLESVQSLLR